MEADTFMFDDITINLDQNQKDAKKELEEKISHINNEKEKKNIRKLLERKHTTYQTSSLKIESGLPFAIIN